jgi:hypothetical protein
MGDLDPEVSLEYELKQEGNGVYLFVLEGEVEVAGTLLGRRDGMGIWETSQIQFNSLSDSRLLLMEVPMNLNFN